MISWPKQFNLFSISVNDFIQIRLFEETQDESPVYLAGVKFYARHIANIFESEKRLLYNLEHVLIGISLTKSNTEDIPTVIDNL